MTEQDKIAYTKVFADESTMTNQDVLTRLAMAEHKILCRMYCDNIPEGATVPTKYEIIQCELAARIILKQGAGGEKSHNENGINRTYGSSNDDDLLKEIIPVAEVF